MSRAGAGVAVVVLASILVGATGATAHVRSVSYSSWELDERGADVVLRIPLLQLSRRDFDPRRDVGSGGAAAGYLAGRLRLFAGDAECSARAAPRALRAPAGWARFRWRVDCAQRAPRRIESAVLHDVAPSHIHIARVSGASGVRERVLSASEARWPLEAGDSGDADTGGTGLVGYLSLGAAHIASGWDHLAFVIALLLLAGSLGEIAGLVSAFTVAHSVTLAIAVLGWARPDEAAIEALIAYSIALVAAENAWLLSGRRAALPVVVVGTTVVLAGLAAAGVGVVAPGVFLGLALFAGCHFALLGRVARPARLRAAVAFAFGLVHGFAFAGVLSELALPRARLAPALFGFNLGVEVGQLVLVAALWPLLRWIARTSPARLAPQLAEIASAAICGFGIYWLVTRAFGS